MRHSVINKTILDLIPTWRVWYIKKVLQTARIDTKLLQMWYRYPRCVPYWKIDVDFKLGAVAASFSTTPEVWVVHPGAKAYGKVWAETGMAKKPTRMSLTFSLRIKKTKLRSLFGDVEGAAPGMGVGAVDPAGKKASSSAADAAAAELGLFDSVGLFADALGDLVIPETTVTVVVNGDAVDIVAIVKDVKLMGVGVDVVVVARKLESKAEWRCFVYAGFTDIVDGDLDFPSPFTVISDLMNIGISAVGGNLQNLAVTYATGDFYVPPSVAALLPPGIKMKYVEEGFEMVFQQDMSRGASNVGAAFLRFFEGIAGDCGGGGNALQQLLCESLTPEAKASFPSSLPIDGKLRFAYSFVVRPTC